MGLFSTTTPFDEQLDKATNELNTEIDWGLILSLCDKVKTTPKGPHEFAGVIFQKINHKIPHVSMQALTVLDACVNNCGKEFHREVASMNFTDCLRDTLSHYKTEKVKRKLRYYIRKWAEDFKEDPELSHFVSFYYQLRGDGLDFPDEDEDDPNKQKREPLSTNPDSVSSQQEADDIAKAIEASLKEEKQKKGYSSSGPVTTTLYPSMLGGPTSTGTSFAGASYSSAGGNVVKKKVKALYDFEAAEDNELTFKAGDLLFILDDSDVNWWKGEGSNGTGLFPSNFVTSDLSAQLESEVVANGTQQEGDENEDDEERETVVKFNEDTETKEFDKDQPVLEVNEDLIDKTLAILQSTDPETTVSDSPDLLRNEESCNQMGKLIDSKLELLDRKHLELSMLNEKILESLQLYDTLMKQTPVFTPPSAGYMPGQMPPSGSGAMYGQVPPHMMQGFPQGTYPPGNPFNPPHMTQGVPPSSAPGPSAAPMGPPTTHIPQTQPIQGQMNQATYNQVYQPNPNYPVTNGTQLDQQQANHLSQPYTTNQSSTNQQASTSYPTTMMNSYHQAASYPSGYSTGGSPQHYPTTSQVSTQPLM